MKIEPLASTNYVRPLQRAKVEKASPGDVVEISKTTRPSPLVEVGDSLALAQAHLLKTVSADGVYRTAYLSGPYETLMADIGLNFAGVKGIYEEEKAIWTELLDNAPPRSRPEEPSSRAMNRLFLSGIRVLKQNQAEELAEDPQFAARLEKAEKEARERLAGDPPLDDFMLEQMARLYEEVTTSEGKALAGKLLDPYAESKCHSLLYSRLGKLVSAQLVGPLGGALPAVGILSDYAADLHGNFRLGKWLRGADDHEERLERLEASVKTNQDANGGWLTVAMTTGLNLMALKARGLGTDDPDVQEAVKFIRDMRQKDGPNGELRQWWCRADAWDTGIAGGCLLASGIPASDPQIQKGIDQVLQAQGSDGRWAFAIGSEHARDNDSTTMPVMFLTSAYRTAAPHQKEAIRKAVLKSFDTLIERQQHDGGWNAWEPTRLGWGNRVPGTLEAAAVDASSTDVTGRVLSALGKVKAAGMLDLERQDKLDHAVQRSMEYLKDSQAPNGSWWARWMAGYICSPGFVLPALRNLKEDAPFVAEASEFLRQHQNPDGGGGETTEADTDKRKAGVGPSTPSQTALAMLALIASSPNDQVAKDPALARAARYLLKEQKNGTWDNQKKLFTTFVGSLYYDAPHNTHCISMMALQAYKACSEEGVDAGLRRL